MFKTFLKLGSATLIAQLANLAFLPIVLRNFPPAEYAKYLLILNISAVMLPFVTLRFDFEVASSESSEKSFDFVVTLIIIFQVVFLLMCILLVALSNEYGIDFGEFTIKTLFLIWLTVTSQSIVMLFTGLALRDSKTSAVNFSAIIQNYSTVFFQILISFFSKTYALLLFGFVLGRISGFLPLFYSIRAKIYFVKIDLFKILDYLKNKKDVILSGIIDAMLLSSPVFLNYYFLDAEKSGIVGMCQSLLLAPVTLIGGTVINGFFVERKSLKEKYDSDFLLSKNTNSIFKKLFLITIAVAFSELIFSETGMLHFLFGHEWSKSDSIFTLLILPYGIQLLASPFIAELFISHQWKKYYLLNSVSLLAGMLMFLLTEISTNYWPVQAASFHIGRSVIVLVWTIKKFSKKVR